MIQIFFKTVFNDPEKYVQFRKFLHVPEPENIVEKKIILIFQTQFAWHLYRKNSSCKTFQGRNSHHSLTKAGHQRS